LTRTRTRTRLPDPTRRTLVQGAAAGLLLPVLGVAGAQHQHHQHGSGAKKPRPELAVGATFAPDGKLWVAGLNGERQLTVRVSADEGRSWAAPRIIDRGSDPIVAHGESWPKVLFGPQGLVLVAYSSPMAKPYTGQVRMLRSEDGGRTFSAPYTVHADRQEITHRYESLAFDAQGTLHTVWIDKRDQEAAPRGADGKPQYRGAAIYRNESRDGGRTFGPDIKLADHGCECCRIALAPTPGGGVAAVWRHVFEPNERDHAFAVLGAPAAATPRRATMDRWAINACPHHGPGLAPAAGGGFHLVWFGLRDGVPAVRYGRLDAAGAPQGEVRVLPDTSAEHGDVISAGRRVAVVWRSFDGTATRLRAWVSADDGQTFTLRELARAKGQADQPRLARRGDSLFAVWRHEGGLEVMPLGASA
jgi:hypothetical protein